MQKKYWISKIINFGRIFTGSIMLAIPLVLLSQGKLDKVPGLITTFMLLTGLFLIYLSLLRFMYPIYRIVGDDLYFRGIKGKEVLINVDNSWKIDVMGDSVIVSKNKKFFVITKSLLGSRQFEEIMKKLEVISIKNSNKSLQPIAKDVAG